MATWIRGKAERPDKRRIVLIYETADEKNSSLERLLERIPYGHVNKSMLECLRIGAQNMLNQMSVSGTGSNRQTPEPQSSQSFSAQSADTSSSLPGNGKGAGFSNAAKRMFDYSGEK